MPTSTNYDFEKLEYPTTPKTIWIRKLLSRLYAAAFSSPRRRNMTRRLSARENNERTKAFSLGLHRYNRYNLQTVDTVRETMKSRVISYLPDETNRPPRNRIILLLIRDPAPGARDEQRSVDTAVRAELHIHRVSGVE